MKNKSFVFALIIMFMHVIAFSQEEEKGQDKKVVIDQVVGIVGKNIIKLSDIESNYSQIRLQRGNENAFSTRCEILERLLETKLMLHQANLDSVVVEDEKVDAELDQRIRMMIRNYGSKEALEKEAGKSIEELKDTYREPFRENIMIQQIRDKITKDVKVTPKEVAEFFTRLTKDSVETIESSYEILQIMKNPEISHEERERVRADLNRLRERIVQGEKFATLAALYSEDPGTAKKGGELGLFTRGEMVSEFEATAFGLKPGEISPIIETRYGFHIIQLIERRGDFVNARHILMIPKVSPLDLQKAKFFLDSISILVKNKKYTFEEAALMFSDDASKTNGGLITNPRDGSSKMSLAMAKEYLQYNGFDKMEEGDITPPLLTKNDMNQDAYRVLFLKTKIKEHKANMNDDYSLIYDAALREAQDNEIKKWAKKVIAQTYIKISDEYKSCDFEFEWIKR